MQHSFGRQAATPKKVFFKIQVIYFNALDDFVTNHYDPSSLFMENSSYLIIQQFKTEEDRIKLKYLYPAI